MAGTVDINYNEDRKNLLQAAFSHKDRGGPMFDLLSDSRITNIVITVHKKNSVETDERFQKLQTIFRLCLLYFQKAEPFKPLKGTDGHHSIPGMLSANTLITNDAQRNRSVLMICLSFVVLTAAALIWVVFYYVRRSDLMLSKDNLSRRMLSAAHTALSKIPTKRIKQEDLTEEPDNCVICFDTYKLQDTVRILPCRHEYHKGCIDPWLLEHRNCPMCKMDILRYYGFVFTGSQESILQVDAEDANSDFEHETNEGSPVPQIRSFSVQIDNDELIEDSTPNSPSFEHAYTSDENVAQDSATAEAFEETQEVNAEEEIAAE